MRILAWILLIVGLGLGAAGAARNPDTLTDQHAVQARADRLVATRDALLAARSAQAEAATEATAAAVAKVEARVEALRAQGWLEGDLDTATAEATAAAEATAPPGPWERFMAWLGVGGPIFGIGTLMVGIGAFLERRAVRQAATAVDPETGGAVDFLGALDALDEALDRVQAELADLPMDAPSATLRTELDTLQTDVIDPVVEGRGQLMARHGTATFAVYFGAFSGGERNLARTWSALTDGHSVVARDALVAARRAFTEARAGWHAAEGDAPADAEG